MARYIIRIARRAGHHPAVCVRRRARAGERGVLRLRRGHPEDLRAGRLRAEHHLARLRRARRDRRRVRDSAARGHPLRSDFAEAETGDPRRRGRDIRAALRPQHPPHRRHTGQGHRSSGGRPAGASTLTQQLARKLFLTDEKTWERKIKEAILAIQIEKRYTKNEIFTLYCNQMYFGHGVYGVQAASRLYFGKAAKDLDARGSGADRRHSAGQRPAEPVREHGRGAAAAQLRADADGGGRLHLAAEAEAARARSRSCSGASRSTPASPAPYFLEDVRKELEARYGAKQLYENGLSIQTALDRHAPGSGQPRPERGPAPDRQAAWLPHAAPQRGGRRTRHRHVQASPLGSRRCATATSCRRWSARADAAAIDARAGALEGDRSTRRDSAGPRRPAISW